MTAFLTRTYDTYHFGMSLDLSEEQLKHLIRMFNAPTAKMNAVLGGRTSIAITELESIGSVVVKHYRRGGLIRHLVKQRYLKLGKTRCQIEYEIMQDAGRLGVRVPDPVAYAYHGEWFYRAWLITREITDHQTLAQLSLTDVDKASAVMDRVLDYVDTLVDHYILHGDLHPGNVLVDADSRVCVIDFDKARYAKQSKHQLRNRYVDRWRRAVIKHGLPEALWKIMRSRLS